jgi:hypothetical protein
VASLADIIASKRAAERLIGEDGEQETRRDWVEWIDCNLTYKGRRGRCVKMAHWKDCIIAP